MKTADDRRMRSGEVHATARARWRAASLVLVVAAGIAATVATGAWLWASARYRVAGDTTAPMSVRAASAEAADAVWPFSREFRARAVTLRALQMVEDDDILGGYDLIHAEYVREARAKDFVPELAAAHKRVYDLYWAISNRAAHVLHGKEQPDGTIKPEDIQRFPKPKGK